MTDQPLTPALSPQAGRGRDPRRKAREGEGRFALPSFRGGGRPVRGGEPSVPPMAPVPHRGMLTLSIMLANIMQGLDNTILNVSLPHIQGSMSTSQDQIAWALTSYIVCAAVMMPLTGWLAGRFGIKPVFLTLHLRVHDRLGAVRHRDEPHPAGDVSRDPGDGRGRADPAGAGDAVAHQPAGTPRHGDGDLRHRHGDGADDGTDARRLVHRILQLAICVLYQSAGRDPVQHRDHDLHALDPEPAPRSRSTSSAF